MAKWENQFTMARRYMVYRNDQWKCQCVATAASRNLLRNLITNRLHFTQS